jgi:hypothetical protein
LSAVASKLIAKGDPDMTVFTDTEITYLRENKLGRLATVGAGWEA